MYIVVEVEHTWRRALYHEEMKEHVENERRCERVYDEIDKQLHADH